jgi:hypothetical protein
VRERDLSAKWCLCLTLQGTDRGLDALWGEPLVRTVGHAQAGKRPASAWKDDSREEEPLFFD